METRQQKRKKAFDKAFKEVKQKHGSGTYSWAEGVTRKSARKIARKWAKEGK